MAAIHSDEFKRDAVRIALTSGLTRRQVASDLAQQARACIYGRLKEHITNTLTVDREVRRREAASGVVGGWRVGTIICRGLEPVL